MADWIAEGGDFLWTDGLLLKLSSQWHTVMQPFVPRYPMLHYAQRIWTLHQFLCLAAGYVSTLLPQGEPGP
jgi:hypothetical protein